MKFITEINKTGKIAVDDNILVKGYSATSGSRILEGFKPLFSAEAVERLEKSGYSIKGKTNVGEFGLDILGETSYYGAVVENGKLIGAAAKIVKENEAEAALSVDLNGYPRRAAMTLGVDYIKPTYSAVSRYGVIAAACSGEQIGVTAKGAERLAEILGIIAGHDQKDGTSDLTEKYTYCADKEIKGLKACIIKELYESASASAKDKLDAYKKKLEKLGVIVDTVSFPLISQAQTAWQILLSAETCNNVSRFDGVKYGYRAENYRNIDELYVNSRTEGMGFLAKATILYGSDVLSKGRYESCYDKAMRIRRIVSEEIKKLFEGYSLIVIPAASDTEFEEYNLSEAFDRVFKESAYTALANLTGVPAAVTQSVQLMAASFNEDIILSAIKATREAE